MVSTIMQAIHPSLPETKWEDQPPRICQTLTADFPRKLRVFLRIICPCPPPSPQFRSEPMVFFPSNFSREPEPIWGDVHAGGGGPLWCRGFITLFCFLVLMRPGGRECLLRAVSTGLFSGKGSRSFHFHSFQGYPQGNSRFLKRTMVEKNGESTPRRDGVLLWNNCFKNGPKYGNTTQGRDHDSKRTPKKEEKHRSRRGKGEMTRNARPRKKRNTAHDEARER